MKRNKFPDYWGVGQRGRSRKIPTTKVIPVFKRDKRTDTDRDGTPNYRDCQPLNPHAHGFFKKAVSVAKKVGKELATVPEVKIEEKPKVVTTLFPKFGKKPVIYRGRKDMAKYFLLQSDMKFTQADRKKLENVVKGNGEFYHFRGKIYESLQELQQDETLR